MKKRIMSLLLALLMLVSMFPAYGSYAQGNNVSVWYFNPITESMEETGSVELYRGGEVYLSAYVSGNVSGGIQWQIEAGQDFWVDIQGCTSADLRVSYGMIRSLLFGNSARIRCAVSNGDEEVCSDPVAVIATDVDNRAVASSYASRESAIAPDPLPAPIAVAGAKAEPADETDTEPADETDTEPADETDTESADETDTEPADETDTEPADETDTEPADEQAAQMGGSSSSGDEEMPNEDVIIHTVTIEYIYSDSSKFAGQRVALPYIAEVAHGATLSGDESVVYSPNCVGYSPDIASIDLSEQGAITGNVNLVVEYSPASVSYTVRHYQQNINDDEYTWVDTTLASGYTEALTSDTAAKSYTGFTALTHYHEEIAADSSTMIDIYYDRNYYLMSFDLDGGYGVSAVYARYGASISVGNPQKAGYTFDFWSSDGTNETDLPSVMPAGNSSYTAIWAPGNTKYTVAYWLENPNSDNAYDFVGSASVDAVSGRSVSGSDDAVAKGIFTADERQYYSFNSTLTNTGVTVAGDGSSVVNVYYDRNEYTLKFYYARSGVSNGTTNYQVATLTNGSSAIGGTVVNATWEGPYATKPTLDSRYTEQTEVIGDYTYYYFTITAKYGADLSAIWPNAPLSNAADNVKFVSWGTQYGSGYHNANTNKNIKGVYSVLDSGLLINSNVTAEQGVNHWMVGYWGNPTMYIYEVYYSLLAGETADRTYKGVDYKKVAQYTVGSTALPSEGQTALSFEGVTNVGMDYDYNIREDGTVIRFYYQRELHTVTFDNTYGTATSYTIPYGGELDSYITTEPSPDYPDELPDDAYSFGGWYQSKEGVGPLDTSITMPDKDLIYYAKWNPVSYTVTIEDGNGLELATEQVNYGSFAAKPTDPTMDDATFIGWYYLDSEGEEHRFDFDTMPITQNITVYAKWRSSLMKQVIVTYVVEDENGNQTQIAESETLMLRVGQTRTFEAKTGNSLYEDYRSGCFPTAATHSITPTEEDMEREEPITYTFVYKQYERIPYQVKFYVQENDGTLRPAYGEVDGKAVFIDNYVSGEQYTEYVEQHWDNDKTIVTELHIPDNLANAAWTLPDEYLPNALKIQRLIIPGGSEDVKPEEDIEANTIVFIYTRTTGVHWGRYLVQYYIQDSTNPDEYYVSSYLDKDGVDGTQVSESPISIPGYTYSYDVTNSKIQSGVTLSQNPDVMSGTVNKDDTLELNFYYKANPYPYQVMYLEEGTNRVLASPKTTDENGQTLMALYRSKVTESAIEIEGYDIVGDSTATIYIEMEAGNTASVNTIVFYYARKSADLVIKKTVALDAVQAAEEKISALPDEVYTQKFRFTVNCPTGFHKSVYDCVIKNSDGSETEGKLVAGTTSFTFELTHGQSIMIYDLAMGEYTITETYVPGFRTSVDGTIQQAYSVALNVPDETVEVEFLNSYPFYTGDLVIMKDITKLDEDDPEPTKPYKVTVVLTPSDEARELDRVITWTDGDGTPRSITIPALTNTEADEREFTLDVLVNNGGDEEAVVMQGVPVGNFVVTETVDGTGYITDYYSVTYNKALHQNDEVTGTNHEVSGVIHGGHPTAVTFHNTYKKGTLVINKTVTQEYEKDSWNGDTFTFQITGTTELPDGAYKVDGAIVTVVNGIVSVKDAEGNDPTITVTRTDDATSWNGSLTFENLPAGYYTVTEISSTNGLDKYTTDSPAENLLVNDTANATEAKFTNTFKRTTGNLQVSKEIVIVTAGSIIDTEQPFTFTVELKDGMLEGPYTCVVKTTSDDTPVPDSADSIAVGSDGKLTFNLKHDQYILIEGLPVGDYLVSEMAVEGYDSSFGDVVESPANYSVDPAVITTGNTTVLNCQNAYPVYYSNLIVSKTVSSTTSHSNNDNAPTDDVFIFEVRISNYSDRISLADGIGAKFYESADDEIPEERSLTVVDNTVTFSLKNGEWVDINLPACDYVIAETGLESTVNTDVLAEHYTSSYKVGGSAGVEGGSHTLVSGEIETIAFTNVYKRHLGTLTINKSATGGSESDVFLFHISGNGIDMDVTVTGSNSVTIYDLPLGSYTVTEDTSWSWRYTATNAIATAKITLDELDKTVKFENTFSNNKWLNHLFEVFNVFSNNSGN